MDLTCLHLLQDLRESLPAFLTSFMLLVSDFTMKALPVLCAVLYWSISRRWGIVAMLSYHCSNLLTLTFKEICGVLRPYHRDPTLVPLPSASSTFSFPSTHSQVATSFFGTVTLWQAKARKWLSLLSGLLLALAMFSRLYLCMHTPQDVLTACALTFMCILAGRRLVSWLDAHPGKTSPAIFLGLVAGAGLLMFLTSRPAAVIRGDSGEVLVDSARAIPMYYRETGRFMGFLVAMLLDEQVTQYEPPRTLFSRFLVGAAGILLFSLFSFEVEGALDSELGSCWGGFVMCFAKSFLMLGLYPLIVSHLPFIT